MSWNSVDKPRTRQAVCHAPRERVSWNVKVDFGAEEAIVTLHVSVWVEIHRLPHLVQNCNVTLHVSVWVEIQVYSSNRLLIFGHAPRERVSWNCNAKSPLWNAWRHAPRERVSWNHMLPCCHKILTAVTLHVSVWVEMSHYRFALNEKSCHAPRERVSWNLFYLTFWFFCVSHAPRERVSWN